MTISGRLCAGRAGARSGNGHRLVDDSFQAQVADLKHVRARLIPVSGNGRRNELLIEKRVEVIGADIAIESYRVVFETSSEAHGCRRLNADRRDVLSRLHQRAE